VLFCRCGFAGTHAPFDGKITVQPEEGDIVLFPSSLVHQVTPTEGDTERISIAVNLQSQDIERKGSDAMPSGMVSPGEPVAMPDVMSDDLYELE
jgi:ectoine hydroxylase-related dioxygenase (phytanoyl-CoA dioxygenase family)